MSKFVAGLIVGVLGVAAAAFVYVYFGFISARADTAPPALESLVFGHAMDASTARHAPKVKNPIAPTEANLIQGARLYKGDCAICHGSPLNPAADVGLGQYPRAPQFLKDPPDMPEYQNFYIVKYGVRSTGMPSWGKIMTDDEIWTVVAFLAHLDKLPPAVDAEWKKPLTP